MSASERSGQHSSGGRERPGEADQGNHLRLRAERPERSGQQSAASLHCDGEVCITCSDEAVPVTVLALLGDDLADVDTGSTVEQVSVALVDARPGDRLLVHAKEAIAKIGALDG